MSPTSWCAFDIPKLEADLASLEEQSAAPGFWDDPQSAQETMRRASSIRSRAETWRAIETSITDNLELVDLASIESHEPLAHMIEQSAQLLLVVGSDDRASSLPRGLVCARTVTRPRLTHDPTVRCGAELRQWSRTAPLTGCRGRTKDGTS